jgi:N6-L-threonylcarbamoyladenine synthase
LVLGIESSCDETAAAVVRDGCQIISNVVSSQVKVHEPYGGVVPELASRHHLRNIVPVVREAFDTAGVQPRELSGIAVTRGPGLVGALLVGIQFAKSLAYHARLPLIAVNHLEGHLFSPRLKGTDVKTDAMKDGGTADGGTADGGTDLPPRHIALLVSGGHTTLVLVEGLGKYRVLGRSRDDAAGEAFDKVAKLLGLGYPGGPVIEALASNGDGDRIHFPRALPGKKELDFSFSGLKTAVANYIRDRGKPQDTDLAHICASFQTAVADVLVKKATRALRVHRANTLVAAGGVIANSAIRSTLVNHAARAGFQLVIPRVDLCTDNGAMIAAAGTEHLESGHRDGLDLNAVPRLPL